MDIFIIWGLGIAFLIIIVIVNKIRGVADTGKQPYRPSWKSGVPTGTLEADSAPRANDADINLQ